MTKRLDEGDCCPDPGCEGHMQFPTVENCSCHLSAPCSACEGLRLVCDACGFEEPEPDVIEQESPRAAPLARPALVDAPLDASRISFRSRPHSSCSMIKEGVYPPGTTKEQVRAVVDGTFGGTFQSFGDGRFTFVAYTD